MKKTYHVFETFRFPEVDEEYEVEFYGESIGDAMPTEVYYQEWLYPPKVCVLAEKSLGKMLSEVVELWKKQIS